MSRWTGDIYITDESGAEIPGSRRHVSRTVTFEEYQRLCRELELQMGEGCMVRHSAAEELLSRAA